MTYWVHLPADGKPWHAARVFEPPAPRPVPGKGFAVFFVEYGLRPEQPLAQPPPLAGHDSLDNFGYPPLQKRRGGQRVKETDRLIPVMWAVQKYDISEPALREAIRYGRLHEGKGVASEAIEGARTRLVVQASLIAYLAHTRPNGEETGIRPRKPENAGKPRRGESGRKPGRPRKVRAEDTEKEQENQGS